MPSKLPQQLVSEIKKLAEEGLSYRDIATTLGIPVHCTVNTIKRYKIPLYTSHAAGQIRVTYNAERRDKERLEIYNKYKGRKMNWLVLNDLHFPFQSRRVIQSALKEKADGAVLSELWDYYGLSVFKKDMLISCVDELFGGLELVKKLKRQFRNIVWFEANHERRVWKLLQTRLADKPDVLEMLFLDDEPPIGKQLKKIGVDTCHDWWIKIGKVIFAHPDWFSNLVLRTTENTQDYFLKEDRRLWGDTDCIVNAHTHHQGVSIKYGQVILESGCGCERMDYLREGKKRIETHQGYVVIQIDADGSYNFNQSKLVRI